MDVARSLDEATLARVVAFHGHLCPGLAMGIHAAAIAGREIGPHSTDEEVVAVVETDMCGVDAIQFLTGCTFGKGNLIHRDWGKNAYSFYRRSDGKAIRISGRPDVWDREPGDAPGPEEATRDETRQRRSRRILAMEPERLFEVTAVQGEPPHQARIFDSVLCARCHEGVMETRIRRLGGRDLCQPCFEHALAGT